MSSIVDAGIIGTGRIASILEDDPRREKPATHAGALVATGRCRLVGGCDNDPERRRLFSQRWGVPAFADARQMLRVTRPRIVVVATHPDSHYRYVSLAAEEGVSVVVCEKPLADTLGSARRILHLERSGAVRIVVNHERRFSRDYQLVRDAVVSGTMGTLLGMTGTLYFGGDQRLDRVFLHDGTHLVDAIHFLAGEHLVLRRRSGSLKRTAGTVILEGVLPGAAVPVTMEVGAGRRYLHLAIRLSFSEGEIEVGNGIFRWRRAVESPYYSGFRSLQDCRRTVPVPTGYFRNMMEEALRLVDDEDALSRSTAGDGYAALAVIRRAVGVTLPLFRR